MYGLAFCNEPGAEGWPWRAYGEKYWIVTGLLPCGTEPGELHGNVIGFSGYPGYKIGGAGLGQRKDVQIEPGSSHGKATSRPGCRKGRQSS